MKKKTFSLTVIIILLCGCSYKTFEQKKEQQLSFKVIFFMQYYCGCPNDLQERIPTDEYIEEITDCIGYNVCNAVHPNPKPYLFPINICCKDTCYRIIATASALYQYYLIENNIGQSEFRTLLQQILKKDDTLSLCNIPSGYYIASSNFYKVDTTDIEYNLFKCNKSAFLEYYFSKDKYGIYNYINDRYETGAIVERLYHWGILVNDGNGSAYYPDIYINEKDYPIYSKDFSEEWISDWMNSFGKKYYIERGHIVKRKKYQMKKKWW